MFFATEEEYAMKTWYDKLFWKKKQLNHLSIYLGKDCITNTHRNLVKVCLSQRHDVPHHFPLSAKKAISCLAVRQCLQAPHSLWVQTSVGAWISAWTNNWVTGLERPTLTASPFHLICFVPFQVCKKNGWISHGLSSPTKTVQNGQMKTKTADSYAGCMGHR